jgi:putative glycosyltransferase (TIGR04372 family)
MATDARVERVRQALREGDGIAGAIPLLHEVAARGDAEALVTLVEAAAPLGDVGPVGREALFLLHQLFPVQAMLPALRRLAPLLPSTESVQNDLGFVLHGVGDPEGAGRAFAAAARLLEARVAAHPLAATGLRILHPGWFVGSFGETAIRLGTLAKFQALGLLPPWRLVLPAPHEKIVNEPLLDLFAPHLTIVKEGNLLAKFTQLAPDLALDTTCLPLRDGSIFYLQEGWRRSELAWTEAGRGPLLALAPQRIEAGRAQLAEHGLPKAAWFVALHVRDPSFHGEADGRRRLDLAARDADIDTYVPTIERIGARGGWVVRLGAPSPRSLPAMARLFDYTQVPCRSPELDLVLIAAARCMIGTLSGPAHVASLFGTPTVHSNGFASTLHATACDLWLPKLYRRRADGRLLSLAESISAPLRGEIRGSVLDDYGIELVANTAEDIIDAAEEMLERLEGRTPADDPAVAETFRRTGNTYIAPMSARFLARHRATLL